MTILGYIIFLIIACMLSPLAGLVAAILLLPIFALISATRLPKPAQKFLRGVVIGVFAGTFIFFAALGVHEWFGCTGTWLAILGCILIAITAPYSKNLWAAFFQFVTFVALVFRVL